MQDARLLPPSAAWERLKDMQMVVDEQPAIAHAVRCLRWADQLDLTLELLRQDDWSDLLTPSRCHPMWAVSATRAPLAVDIWPSSRRTRPS
jgi:hypothetical protein